MPTTSATPTKADDPVAAKIPKAARAKTQRGAEAFAAFYMTQVNRAFTRADPTQLEGLSRPGCNICRAFEEGAEDMKKEGVHHQGLSIEPTSATIQRYDEVAQSVLVWTTQHSVPVVNREGKQVRTTTGSKGIFLATLVYDKHWWVNKLQVAK
ncbi:MAG: DUF6318 family protein [Intrasporangium sp.]|uniref:DUF6318 family protein n=1 Tax=Intrasporangium sp. TaxID=1925024 RepID=UPI0026489414|nr:DUF6318 family protein [Intrasporangium sp.]MDN5797820.1 DUF6318 family protein [Intrasporangium sp.]